VPSRKALALVTGHLALVEHIARRMGARLPTHVRLEDLVSAGNVGLLDAAKRFDPKRGVSFPTFAGQRIRGAILDDLRHRDSLSRDARALSNRIAAAEHALTGRLGRAPGQSEVAAELGVSVTELHAWRAKLSWRSDGEAVGFDDAAPDFLDRFAPDASPTPLDAAEAAELRDHLEDAISKLPDRLQLALSLVYGEQLTQREASVVLGVTESRVCQMLAEAMARLRGLVDPGLTAG